MIRKNSLYRTIQENLKDEILSGKAKGFSESKIIHRFQVSSTTAKRVLDELEREGLIIRKQGKRSVVVSPKEKKIKDFGIVFFDFLSHASHMHPYIARIVDGIENKTREKGHHLHTYTTRNKSLTDHPDSALYSLIIQRKIDGLFISSPLANRDLLFLQKERIPFVVLGMKYVGLKTQTVIFNSKDIIKETCERLFKSGCRKIGLITGPLGERNRLQRGANFALCGYKNFLRQNGLLYQKSLFREKDNFEEDGYRAMNEFYLLGPEARPDSVIIASTASGKGALDFSKEDWHPIIVPYVEEKIAHSYYIFNPLKKLGETAFDLLEKSIVNPAEKPQQIVVPLTLCFQGSLGERLLSAETSAPADLSLSPPCLV